MGPTDLLREWFQSQPAEVQQDMAFLLAGQLIDESMKLAADTDQFPTLIVDWLTPNNEFKYRTVGKAISFAAVFEATFSDRFTEKGWEMPRKISEQVIAEHPEAATTARRMLDEMPQRMELWKRIGDEWEPVKKRLNLEKVLRWAAVGGTL